MNPTTKLIGPGAIVEVEGETFCVKRWETSDSVFVRNLTTLSHGVVTLAQISRSLSTKIPSRQMDLSAIDEEDWDNAIERFRILRPLVWNAQRTRVEVERISAELLVSPATAYRWISKIEEYGSVSCLLRKGRSDKGDTRINEDVEQIVQEVVASYYLTDVQRSTAKTAREVSRLCRNKKLPAPSLSTIQRRIDEIYPEERERRRRGRNAALDYRPQLGTLPGNEHINAIWQIDHTRLDIELVDEKDRISIGNPWITLAIDTYSRMVVGWYVSFDPPGTLGTGICIANAILPKDELLFKLGVNYPWPCQGKPGIIQADNAKEFRGNVLKMACNEHGFNVKFRPVKKPEYGAYIERMLGTLLEEIHGLDGTTFSNPQKKGEYDSAANAAMTLDEFELWLANLILGAYHHRKHGELGCPPIAKFQAGILGDDTTPGVGLMPIAADPGKLRIDFLPMEERTIQPYGVVLDYILYHDPVLDKWIGSLDPKTRKQARKFVFRRDPRNISYLLFWDPDQECYYRIPYRDISRPAISLWELRRIQAHLSAQGKKEIDEDMIFGALNEMRRIEESAKELTKKQRRDQERRRRHDRVPAPLPAKELAGEEGPLVEKTIVRPAKAPGKVGIDLTQLKPYEEIDPT